MSLRRRHRLSTWVLLLTVLGSLRAVAAESPKVVLLEAVGNPVDVDALRTSLEDWLRSMQLELHLVSVLPPPGEPSFARVRVVWTDEQCVVEVFADSGVLRRRKSLPRGGPPLLVSESAALIAQAGVQELSVEERRRHPLPVPVAVTTEVPVEPLPAATSPFELGLAAYAQGRAYSEQAPVVFGGGAELAVSFGEGPWHPGVSLLTAYQGPVAGDATLVAVHLELQTVQFRIFPSLRRKVGPFEVEFGVGGGLDALISHASASSSEVSRASLRRNRVDASPFFSVMAALRWKVTPASAIFLRALVDLDPARRRYSFTVGQEREYLLEPWIARPALQVGFSFDLVSRREGSP